MLSAVMFEVVIHPESIIHSMVEYTDGSIISQMGNPDMALPLPILCCGLSGVSLGWASLDLFSVKQLNFEEPDLLRFPCLKLAQDAIRTGGTAPAVLNAAERGCRRKAFLNAQIKFTDIPHIVESALSSHSVKEADTIDLILSVDQETRQEVGSKIKNHMIPDFLVKILAFIGVISILVTVHELGHFLVAEVVRSEGSRVFNWLW